MITALAGIAPIIGGFTGIGAVFLAIGLAMVGWRHHFRSTAEAAPGMIVGLRACPTSSTATGALGVGLVYRPTVRFTTRDGTRIEAESRVGTNPAPGRVGGVVVVYYDPANPTHFTTSASSRVVGLVAWVFVGVGGLVASVSLVALVGTMKP